MQLSAGHPRRGLAKGFSLLELVMVVAIVGIVSAIAVPRYSTAACNYRAEVAARRVAKDIGKLRGQRVRPFRRRYIQHFHRHHRLLRGGAFKMHKRQRRASADCHPPDAHRAAGAALD
jgi:prepilin-type N-terminal cleavage/methylation domain-containing protein